MKAIIYNGDIEDLRPIVQSWYEITRDNPFGIEVSIDNHLADLRVLVESDNTDLLVLLEQGRPVGYLGTQIFDSPLGRQVIANEHYWYVLPDKRGIGSLRLLKLATQWADQKGCSHIIMSASNLASDMHDKVGQLYKRIGMKKFETSFIMEV
jgi:GNAT superfamily N-acetyltransferase